MALVITLIMLSVITFMAVTFLAISRQERGAVTTATEQTTARLAADAAQERVKADMLVSILATTNPMNFGLLVSTNYFNKAGFVNGVADIANVNYNYVSNSGAALNNDQFRQNVANLLYSPRPPVFIRTNSNPNTPLDFRFYLDLNRNGRFDTNGLQPVISGDPIRPYYNTNGNLITLIPPWGVLSNSFVGDPEWIGILERPDQPHSSSNKFVARYAYAAIPSGKTLDLNYSHNYARRLDQNMRASIGDGFARNQGVGTWEINLAAFLADLNTNQWMLTPYTYSLNLGAANTGPAFDDALSLLRYRYANDYNTLKSANSLFDNNLFNTDGIDTYSDGFLMLTNPPVDNDDATKPWAGADNTNHFFTTQDFFDRTKNPQYTNFINRLVTAGGGVSSYDRYTYYRMLEQMGTDSAPESGKLNVNYVNLDAQGRLVSSLVTNLEAWTPADFFTNAADRLLRTYTADWFLENPAGYMATFYNADVNQYTGLTNVANVMNAFSLSDVPSFSITNIPVWVSNRFVYSPAIHRLLQVAANVYDATTNREFAIGSGAPFFPSVFRPVFTNVVEGPYTNIYVSGFVEVGRQDNLTPANNVMSQPRDLNDPADRVALQPYDNVYGVPIVVGAKKGLPNFNEFALESVSQITRKLELRRLNVGAEPNRTNMMLVVNVSNVLSGVELWNSYRSNYSRAVDIFVTNDMSIVMVVSNENSGPVWWPASGVYNPKMGNSLSIAASQWKGRTKNQLPSGSLEKASFRVPLMTNFMFLSGAIYRFSPAGFNTNLNLAFETGQGFPQPRFYLTITNRLRCIMLDQITRRVIDYVQLGGLNTMRDLSEEIRDENNTLGYIGLWATNRVGRGDISSPPVGVQNQIDVSMGNYGTGNNLWQNSGVWGGGQTAPQIEAEIAGFRAFMGYSSDVVNTNLVQQAPFSASKRMSQLLKWQANDPLVHYTVQDLQYVESGSGLEDLPVTGNLQVRMSGTIPNVNNRYLPWGSGADPVPFNPAYKDPLVKSSDDWDFPTNKFPNVGWLGRVHRGTPWQTVYMKATDVGLDGTLLNNWKNWSGASNDYDAVLVRPAQDRILFDVFTAAVNENAGRGQLSVNQTNLAAWSAVLSGVVVLTNNRPTSEIKLATATPRYDSFIIQPAGVGTNSPVWKMVSAINTRRSLDIVTGTGSAAVTNSMFPGHVFRHAGDVLATPELTDQSPFLNQSDADQKRKGIDDAAYERLPQQIMSLLRLGDSRFVIYAFGQALKPAPRSIITSGTLFGMCTNYQITAEVATRAVVRVEGAPMPGSPNIATPHLVIENFNVLGTDQ